MLRTNTMRSISVPVVLAILLTSCGTVRFDPRGCPVERKYTKAEQDQFLKDLPKTPPSIKGALDDYSILREKTRACRGEG